MKKMICKDCKKEFEYTPNPRYPRKYCKKCSEERKKSYANIANIKIEDCTD